jgi:hypothetical protein
LLSVEHSSEHLSGLLAPFNMAPSISVGFTEPMSALTLALLQFAFRRRQLHTSRESALGWNLPECDKDHLTAPLDAIKESTCITARTGNRTPRRTEALVNGNAGQGARPCQQPAVRDSGRCKHPEPGRQQYSVCGLSGSCK